MNSNDMHGHNRHPRQGLHGIEYQTVSQKKAAESPPDDHTVTGAVDTVVDGPKTFAARITPTYPAAMIKYLFSMLGHMDRSILIQQLRSESPIQRTPVYPLASLEPGLSPIQLESIMAAINLKTMALLNNPLVLKSLPVEIVSTSSLNAVDLVSDHSNLLSYNKYQQGLMGAVLNNALVRNPDQLTGYLLVGAAETDTNDGSDIALALDYMKEMLKTTLPQNLVGSVLEGDTTANTLDIIAKFDKLANADPTRLAQLSATLDAENFIQGKVPSVILEDGTPVHVVNIKHNANSDDVSESAFEGALPIFLILSTISNVLGIYNVVADALAPKGFSGSIFSWFNHFNDDETGEFLKEIDTTERYFGRMSNLLGSEPSQPGKALIGSVYSAILLQSVHKVALPALFAAVAQFLKQSAETYSTSSTIKSFVQGLITAGGVDFSRKFEHSFPYSIFSIKKWKDQPIVLVNQMAKFLQRAGYLPASFNFRNLETILKAKSITNVESDVSELSDEIEDLLKAAWSTACDSALFSSINFDKFFSQNIPVLLQYSPAQQAQIFNDFAAKLKSNVPSLIIPEGIKLYMNLLKEAVAGVNKKNIAQNHEAKIIDIKADDISVVSNNNPTDNQAISDISNGTMTTINPTRIIVATNGLAGISTYPSDLSGLMAMGRMFALAGEKASAIHPGSLIDLSGNLDPMDIEELTGSLWSKIKTGSQKLSQTALGKMAVQMAAKSGYGKIGLSLLGIPADGSKPNDLIKAEEQKKTDTLVAAIKGASNNSVAQPIIVNANKLTGPSILPSSSSIFSDIVSSVNTAKNSKNITIPENAMMDLEKRLKTLESSMLANASADVRQDALLSQSARDQSVKDRFQSILSSFNRFESDATS